MTRFAHLLPANAVLVEADSAMWETGLHKNESLYVENAVEKRKREFTAGRNCAREALRILGITVESILVGPMREPAFPANISGTITHTDNYCAAAVVLLSGEVASIGIDAETNAALSEDVSNTICTTTELGLIKQLPRSSINNWPTLVFSAKESFYKAWFQMDPMFLDFHDVSVKFDLTLNRFSIVANRGEAMRLLKMVRFHGRYWFDDQLICTAVTASKVS